MKAVVFHGIGDIRIDDVPDPKIVDPQDAVIRITASAICGTDLHLVRGTLPGMKPGTILGHEAVGIVEEAGRDVRNLKPGDRVVALSSIACGSCSYCRAGYHAQCDHANPRGPMAGTCFFGGPETAGAIDGLQAERARIPYASVTLVKIPDEVGDDQALLCSDIFPTGYFAADIAEIEAGDTVAVFGCGPVGQFAIAAARMLGAGRLFAIDRVPDRLEMARAQGAETVDFDAEDPVEAIRRLTGGIGVDRAIDAVGVDAEPPREGPAAAKAGKEKGRHEKERREVAPEAKPRGDLWKPGDAPSQVLDWAVKGLAKAGTLSIVGVYPPSMRSFPIGSAMNKNLTVQMGNCNHRKYAPMLLDLVKMGGFDPLRILTSLEPLTGAIEAYQAFDVRRPGWIKVELAPVAVA